MATKAEKEMIGELLDELEVYLEVKGTSATLDKTVLIHWKALLERCNE